MVEPAERLSALQKSGQFGGSHGDTKSFDDLEALGWKETPVIKRVAIYHDNNLAFGLETEYENPSTHERKTLTWCRENPSRL